MNIVQVYTKFAKFTGFDILVKFFFSLNQKIRFVLVGGYNTVFGISLYALLYNLLHDKINYIIISVINHILAVTNAFFCYRIFVFLSKNNIYKEYIKTHISYIVALIINIVGMYVFVSFFKLDPRIVNVMLSLIIACTSFFLHKHFSFKR